MSDARDPRDPQKYAPENESPRECCANLCETFKALAARHSAWVYVDPAEAGAWASRLERAVQMLDQEKAQHQRDVDEYNHLSQVLFEYGRHREDCCSFRPAREIPGGREERIPCNCGFHEIFAPPHGLSPIPKSWLKP